MTDFDEELAQLRAEVVEPDAAATSRVAARLSRSIAGLAAGGAAATPRPVPWARPLQLVTSFVVGGVVGAALYGALRAPRVENVYIEHPAAPVQVSATSEAPVTSAVPEFAPVAPPLLASARSAAFAATTIASSDRASSLAEQQALLDVARVAYARGNYPLTLQTLATHAARFPKSVLAEEREALQIKALATSERLPEARTLAHRFQARHPQSLLLPSIRDSVGTIP